MERRSIGIALMILIPLASLAWGEQPAAPVAPGEAGIAWYSRWDDALAEAKRSNRPILFQSASAQCSGVPGVF